VIVLRSAGASILDRRKTGAMTDRMTNVQRKTATPLGATKPARSLLAGEAPAIAGILTTIVFFAYGDALLGNLQNH
jgi:hypothetical protein